MRSTPVSAPPAGPWHGWFECASGAGERSLTSFALEVRGERLEAEGTDDGGAFAIEGSWDAATRVVRWRKRYEGAVDGFVVYLGAWDREAGTIAGRWRILNDSTHGRFVLWPGAAPEAHTVAPDADTARRRITRRWQRYCTVDLDALRFGGEQQMLETLFRDEVYRASLKKRTSLLAFDDARSAERLLVSSGAVRLSRTMLPRVFSAFDRVAAAFGLLPEAEIELLCEPRPELNAHCSIGPGDRISIQLTSGLVNALDEDGLAYIIGHELGHALLGHLEFVLGPDDELDGLSSLRSLALRRYQEISADRAGLLCCPSLDVALRTEFVMHSGVYVDGAIGSTAELLRGAREAVASAKVAGAFEDREIARHTHPYGPMRTLAVEWFSRSEALHRLRGLPGGELSDAELEARTAELVSIMNPVLLGVEPSDDAVVELVCLSALALAEATDGASREEIAAIRRLGRAYGEALQRARAMPLEVQQVRVVELAESLSLTMPQARRLRLVEDLILVAQVDGEVSPEETAVLTQVAILLDAPGDAVWAALAAVNAGLD